MLYVLSGSDFKKLQGRIAELTKGHEVVRFGEGGELLEASVSKLNTGGLFSSKIALLLDRPLENAVQKEFFIEHVDNFHKAQMPVVAVVSDLDATTKKKLPKGAVVETYEVEKEETPLPNAFALADAFIKGDRKTAWVLYRRFMESGVTPEELHGTLAWQARALVLASKAKTAEEAGLKPFAYTKSKSALSKLKVPPEEVSRELVSLYHRSRMGEGSLENLLEAFLLKKV